MLARMAALSTPRIEARQAVAVASAGRSGQYPGHGTGTKAGARGRLAAIWPGAIGMSHQLHHGDLPDGIAFGSAVAIDTQAMGLNPHRARLSLDRVSGGAG